MRLFVHATLAFVVVAAAVPAEAAKPEAVAAHKEGLRLAKNNQIAGAIAALTRATELDPSFADAWADLGNTYLAAQNPAKAVTAFQGALKANPNLQDPRYNLAYALRKTGQHGEAAKHYKIYLSKAPDEADAHYGLAESLKKSGDLLGAAEAYEAYARVEKRNGQEKWKAKAKAQAVALRKQAAAKPSTPAAPVAKRQPKLAKKPDVAVAAVPAKKGLHMSFSGEGAAPTTDAPPVASAAAQVPAAAPASDRPSAFRTGLESLQRGEYEGAEARLRVALGDAPNDPIVLAAYGSAQLGQLNGIGAESSYRKALTEAPNAAQPGIYLGLGEAQRIQGKLDEAKRSYQSAIGHADASTSVKRFSQERLDALQ